MIALFEETEMNEEEKQRQAGEGSSAFLDAALKSFEDHVEFLYFRFGKVGSHLG